MDPNAALEQIRISAGELRSQDDDGALEGSQVGNLLDHVEALDEWLSKGGFLPRDWQERFTYLVQDGFGKGSYRTRWEFTDENLAIKYFNSINVHSGFKKRLVRQSLIDGRELLARVLT